MALITNGPSDVQRLKIHVLGIADWFRSIVISGEIGKAKPDPEVFDIALQDVGVDRSGVWHIGDNLVTDVDGANAAGLGSVWLNRLGTSAESGSPRPDIEVNSLEELAHLLYPAEPT